MISKIYISSFIFLIYWHYHIPDAKTKQPGTFQIILFWISTRKGPRKAAHVEVNVEISVSQEWTRLP